MATEVKKEIELEIAHVLFIDTVGYSKLLISEQRELLDKLNHVVRSTPRFRAAESAGKLICLPTGDGMALVFLDSPEAPAQCASEISRALKDSLRLPLRMGIHSGPVSRVVDVNDRSNAAGAGINIAQRVMSCGDAGHILLSKRAADDLVEYAHWQGYLHEIGECEVKHGKKIALVNFYSDEVGNPELPTRCREQKRRFFDTAIGFSGWRKIALITAILVVLFIAGYAMFLRQLIYSLPKSNNGSIALPIRDKSIAVLPFENLSDDKENAYFADGVQDEILTVLAKVADLKVISRTSVMSYKVEAQRNLREIAKTLGVAHVVEGSVQRVGGQVRVSAQLIDARTDTHLWGEHYDRELADVFAIESEVAEQIVSQLKARLSPREKAAIQERPTSNVAAYDLYIQAKALMASAVNVRPGQNLIDAAHLLEEAIARDPAFLLGYCRLASAHDIIYLASIDHTPSRLAAAQRAVDAALRLRPGSGEAHLALAEHLYCGYLNYDRAREELAVARNVLPNEPRVFELTGYIDRRQSRWSESMANLERALELDPRNSYYLQQIARSFDYLRRFAEEAAILDRALAIVPKDAGIRIQRATIDLESRADPKPLHSVIEIILRENPKSAPDFADQWLYLALCERDYDAANQALGVVPEEGYTNEGFAFPKSWFQAVVARARGDTSTEQIAFTTARSQIDKTMREQPDYAQAFCVLGMIDAGLGRKAEAIREGQRACELLPVSKESINGSLLMQYLAVIYAWSGENDLALDQLAATARIPSALTYGDLQLHPFWDALRSDPRFQEIVASLAPEWTTR